jgi:hypothetical protein
MLRAFWAVASLLSLLLSSANNPTMNNGPEMDPYG